LKEILTTERVYLKQLKKFVKHVVIPLRQGKFKEFTAESYHAVFSEILVIVKLNSIFLEQLEQRMAQWPTIQTVGDLFLKMAPLFNLYEGYIKKYDKAMNAFIAFKKYKHVAEWVDTLRVGPLSDTVQSFMILPVQRLPRYEMLLKALIHRTPENHVDRRDLNLAYDSLREVNTSINLHAREYATFQKIEILCKENDLKRPESYIGQLLVTLKQAKHLPIMDKKTKSCDPFCVFGIKNAGDAQLQKSSTKYKTLNPAWDEDFAFFIENCEADLHIDFFDKDTLKDDEIGQITIPLSKYVNLTSGTMKDDWFDIKPGDKHQGISRRPSLARISSNSKKAKHKGVTGKSLGCVQLCITYIKLSDIWSF